MDNLLLSPEIEQIPHRKILLNIGGGLDIITGEWVKGVHGEMILLGGLGFITGNTGPGNTFKTTILNGMILRAMGQIFDSCKRPEKKNQKELTRYRSSKTDYDTEVNVQEARLGVLSSSVEELHGQNLFSPSQQLWKVTDKTVMWGDAFFENLKEFCRHKRKNAKQYEVETPFLDRDGKSLMKIILPTFGLIDSLTDFQTENEEDIMENNALGDSKANMLFAKSGLFKTRLLTELPYVCSGSYHFIGMTAQINTVMAMGGPPGQQPIKKLQFLPSDQKIVGATNKFTYATSISFNATRAAPLVDGNREAEYTHPTGQKNPRDTDLMKVPLTVTRNKNGPTGVEIMVIATQKRGLEATLTEFHNIREAKRFGIIGSGQWYTLALYPECAIQRTTIRKKIYEDKKLRNAILYTSEMQQMSVYMGDIWAKYECTPQQLYKDLKDKGYDWDLLLSSRPQWRLNNDCHPVPFLSTMDLLRMRTGEYFPFWMTEDKKGIKPEYQFTYAEEEFDKYTNELLEELEAKAEEELKVKLAAKESSKSAPFDSAVPM